VGIVYSPPTILEKTELWDEKGGGGEGEIVCQRLVTIAAIGEALFSNLGTESRGKGTKAGFADAKRWMQGDASVLAGEARHQGSLLLLGGESGIQKGEGKVEETGKGFLPPLGCRTQQ